MIPDSLKAKIETELAGAYEHLRNITALIGTDAPDEPDQPTLPGTVQNLRVFDIKTGSMKAEWDAAPGADDYRVDWTNGQFRIVEGLSLSIPYLTADNTYNVVVTPRNAHGEGPKATVQVRTPKSDSASTAPPIAEMPEQPKPDPRPPTDSKIVGWDREAWFMGMNQAAGDFAGGKMPGKFDTDYTYPNKVHLQGAVNKGFRFARFPFKRGRLQHSVRGPLNQMEVARVRKFLDDCHDLGMAVKTDPHDYFTIEGREATAVELIDFHMKFLAEFADHPALVMIGLQNEPKGTSGRWNVVANELVREIRTVTDKIINVPGDSYQSVTRWMKENPLYPLDYPNICYGGHLYMDHDASGTWHKKGSTTNPKEPDRMQHVDPMQGVRMLEGWIKNFLEPNDCYGHIGEIGVPWENESALLALDNFLAFAKSQPRILGVTYWADGPWWGVNKEGIPPVNAIRSNGKWHEPTLNVVQKYVKR